jgi:hypothetical protein
MSYPLSVYPLANYGPQVMTPRDVDAITTSAQCRSLVNSARDAAMVRAAAFNDPRYYQFAESFNIFANADQANINHYSNNRTTLNYHGGCDLLNSEETRHGLWNSAKQKLREEVIAWHNDEGSIMESPKQPTISCFSSNTDGVLGWRCN